MKSRAAIEFDFRQAMNRADELDQVASEMKRMANNDMQSSLQQLSAAWKGEAASAYLTKGGRLKEKVLKSAGDLNKTASTIRSVARRVYNAEMAAYRIAMERVYES